MRPPEECPNCGAAVPRNARACPECGSDENTGWSEATNYDGLDLPDDSFDYDDFVKNELGEGRSPSPPRGLHWAWWLVAIALLAAIALALLR